MERIDLAYLYNLGSSLGALRHFTAGDKVTDKFTQLYRAQELLTGILGQNIYPLRTSRSRIQEFHNIVSRYIETQDYQYPFTQQDVAEINSSLYNLEVVLYSEFSIADAYYVSQKGGYDTVTLLFEAEKLFPADIALVSVAIPDIREAGKCIAFSLPTAAGFHIHRANETVMRFYYDVETKNATHPASRNIEKYLEKMEKLKVGDPKVIASLRNIKDLHRNPLIHPEHNLSNEQALALIGAVLSSITIMLEVIKAKRPPPPKLVAPT